MIYRITNMDNNSRSYTMSKTKANHYKKLDDYLVETPSKWSMFVDVTKGVLALALLTAVLLGVPIGIIALVIKVVMLL